MVPPPNRPNADGVAEALLVVHERLERLEHLVEIGALISSTLGQDEILRLMELACKLVHAETGSVLLLDETTNELYFRAALGEKGAQVAPYRLRVGEGVCGWVAEHREPALVNDPAHDPRFRRDIAEAVDFVPRSILCVPLEARGRLLGVVEVLNRRDGRGFDTADLGLFRAFANQAGIALDNARLVARLRQKIDLANAELIEANRELKLEKSRIEAIVRGMADGLVALDAAGIVQLVNPAAELMLGVREQELQGRHFEEAFSHDGLRDLMDAAVHADDRPRRAEVAVEEPERRILAAYASPVPGDGDQEAPIIVALSDITALKELSEMKSDYVSAVSHELRSPLTSIKGFVAALGGNHGQELDPPTREDFHTIIQHECDRLLRLINDLLDVSRLEAGKPLRLNLETVDIAERLRQAIQAQGTYTDRHRFALHLPDGLSPVQGDPDRFDQIVANLLSNAVKYSPDGGNISVAVRDVDGHIEVAVTDSGIGMGPEHLATVFERYARVETRGTRHIRGTGLGLFLSKQLVELHGGRIWVDSELGKGSTFTFRLPKRHETTAEQDAAGDDAHGAQGNDGGQSTQA